MPMEARAVDLATTTKQKVVIRMSENVSNTDTLSAEQRKAIEALAAGATKEMAAAVAERTVRTLDRWIADEPAFVEALRAAGDEAVADASRRLKGLLTKALTALEKILDKPGVEDKDRLRAINMTISHAMKLAEYAELEERVRALEESRNGQS